MKILRDKLYVFVLMIYVDARMSFLSFYSLLLVCQNMYSFYFRVHLDDPDFPYGGLHIQAFYTAFH